MKTPITLINYVACAALLLTVAAHGQDTKIVPDGTWTWSTPGRNGGPDRTTTLTIKTENSKLTGKISAPGRGAQAAETPISEVKLDRDTISFLQIRENNGNSNTNKYSGKITAARSPAKLNPPEMASLNPGIGRPNGSWPRPKPNRGY